MVIPPGADVKPLVFRSWSILKSLFQRRRTSKKTKDGGEFGSPLENTKPNPLKQTTKHY